LRGFNSLVSDADAFHPFIEVVSISSIRFDIWSSRSLTASRFRSIRSNRCSAVILIVISRGRHRQMELHARAFARERVISFASIDRKCASALIE
jgi:hypothetical protein